LSITQADTSVHRQLDVGGEAAPYGLGRLVGQASRSRPGTTDDVVATVSALEPVSKNSSLTLVAAV
jgi:hypothetical protein